MKSVSFTNAGVIDARAIRTFGISAKDKADAIGFFGTGLKYAIAICLREGQGITLWADGVEYVFAKGLIEVRGQPFEIITMNGEELPFTTRLGVNWELWQSFRELFCNCFDEKNPALALGDNLPPGGKGETRFIVTGEKFYDIALGRDKIILRTRQDLKLESSSREVEVYDQPSDSVFYRGIKVMNFDRPAAFTYNIIRHMALTEDRTLAWPQTVHSLLALGVAALESKPVIRRALTSTKEFAEHGFDYGNLSWMFSQASTNFLEVLAKEFRINNDKLNKSAREAQRKIMNCAAAKHYEAEAMTDVESQQLERSKSIIAKVWPDFLDHKILVVKTLGQETMAMADSNEDTMVVSKRAFEMGTKYLTSTLIEEFLHLKTGYSDCTRELQTHLFDSICTLIENHVIAEPI